MLVLQNVCSTILKKILYVCNTITMYFSSVVQCLYHHDYWWNRHCSTTINHENANRQHQKSYFSDFLCVSSTNVMVVLVSSTSTNGAVIRRIVMLAAPILINRSMTNYCAGVSGKGNRIHPRWWPNKKRNGHLSPRSRTNTYHLTAYRPPLFLIGHYL